MKNKRDIIGLVVVIALIAGLSVAAVYGYVTGEKSAPIANENTNTIQRDLSDLFTFQAVDAETTCTKNNDTASLSLAKKNGFITDVNYKNYSLASTCIRGEGDVIDYFQILNIPTEQQPKTSSWVLAVLMQGSEWRYYDFEVNMPMSDNLSCALVAGSSGDFATVNCNSANGGAVFSGQVDESYTIDLTTGMVTLVYACKESPIVIKTPAGASTAIYDRKCTTNFEDKNY